MRFFYENQIVFVTMALLQYRLGKSWTNEKKLSQAMDRGECDKWTDKCMAHIMD